MTCSEGLRTNSTICIICACVAGSKNVQEFSAAEVREIDPNVNEAIVSSIHTVGVRL